MGNLQMEFVSKILRIIICIIIIIKYAFWHNHSLHFKHLFLNLILILLYFYFVFHGCCLSDVYNLYDGIQMLNCFAPHSDLRLHSGF